MFCAQSKKKEMGFFGPIKNNFGDTDRPSLVFFIGPNYFGHFQTVWDRNECFGNSSKCEIKYVSEKLFKNLLDKSENNSHHLERLE